MREISFGIRFNFDKGFSFFGFEEVNDLINAGGRVISINPGGPLFEKRDEDGENVSVTFMGFVI